MAASIGTWTGFTNGSDPSGTLTIDSGSNRKFVLLVMGEADSGSVSVTVTVGGQSPSESKSLNVELGAGAADILIRAYIWNEAAIAAMTGSSCSWSDGYLWSKISWGYATVQDTDQSATDAPTDSSSSAQSVTCTWGTTTTSSGIVVGAVVADSANRAPMDTTLTARMTYSVADYAVEVGDGSGGGSIASSITMTNDQVANSGMGGMALFFAGLSGIVQQAMYHYRNHGVI